MILRRNEQLGWKAGRFQSLSFARRTNAMTVKVTVSSLSASPLGLKNKAEIWLEKELGIQFWGRGKVESSTHGLLRGHQQGGLHAICDRAMAMARTASVLFVLLCALDTSADAVVVGGPRPIVDFTNNLEIDELANFAVDQYKSHLNSISDISFSKMLAAKEQVVQGTMYYLTVEVIEGGVPKQYEAKVWVKPWEGFEELESFLPSAPSHSDNAVDLTAKSGDLKKE